MKKILSISVLLILIINLFYSSYATELGTKEVTLIKWCEEYFTYQGEKVYVPYVAYLKDGTYMPAYCMNPNVAGIGTDGVNSYNITANGKITNEAVWKVLINSYPYKSLSELGLSSIEEVFYATKLAVYTALGERNKEDYQPVDSGDAQRVYEAYLKILADAEASTEVLTNNDKISISSVNDWNIDGEYLSKTYKLNSVIQSGTFSLELSGNLPDGSKLVNESGEEKTEFSLNENFKIMVPIDKIDEIYNFSLNATSTLKTYPIYFGKSTISGKQDYALVGYTTETLSCNFSDKTVKNTTKITIIKKEYGSDKRLTGVKFNLLDENKSIKYENLITDDAGEIEITGLLPGKYYVQEVETLDGYNLYTDLIEVEVTLNEEIDVLVNNTVKSVTEVTKDTSTIEVVENVSENIYESNVSQTQVVSNTVKKLPVTGY